MKSYLNHFNDRSSADMRDLADAMAAVENGYNQRFLNTVSGDNHLGKRSKDARSDDLLDIIITQLSYEDYLVHTVGRIREAQNTVDRALAIATLRFDEEQAKMDALEAHMAVLPDGTKVAMDVNGTARTLDGARVDPEVAAQAEFTPDNPSYETISEQQDRVDTAHKTLKQIRDDELRLGDLHEEVDDKPPRHRLDEINEEIEDILQRSEAAIENNRDNDVKVEARIQPTVSEEIKIPSL